MIGNSAYKHAPELANPVNDAEAISSALERLDFEVIKGIDLTRNEFAGKVRDFSRAMRGADVALLFYAGHGLQVDGRNYLAPVETRLEFEADLEFETIRLESIMTQMEREERTNLIFLDACRNNPLSRNLARSMGTRAASIGRGLAPIESGVGTLISFATQPGNVALDGKSGNSPFTESLIKHIETPGEDIAVLLRKVRQEVIRKTDGAQVPWGNSSLTGPVILKQEEATPEPPAEPEGPSQFELSFWDSIKDRNYRSYFETYLAQFPEGRFASIAKLRIAEIERTEKAAVESAEQEKQAWEKARAAEELRAQLESERKAREKAEAARLADQERMAAERKAALKEAAEARKAAEKTRQEVEKRLAELAEATQQAEQKAESDKAPDEATEEERELQVAAHEQPNVEFEEAEIDPKENRDLVRSIQQQLNRVGCSAGGTDGIWGRNTERGLASFGKHANLASLDPSQDLLETLKAQRIRVCPLVCETDQQEVNGKCIAKIREASRPAARAKETTASPPGNCPENPVTASRRVITYVNRSEIKTGTHSCGRRIQCTHAGGNRSRECRWLDPKGRWFDRG